MIKLSLEMRIHSVIITRKSVRLFVDSIAIFLPRSLFYQFYSLAVVLHQSFVQTSISGGVFCVINHYTYIFIFVYLVLSLIM